MVFSSPLFLFFFLPIVLIGNHFLKTKWSNLFLLCASLFFYAWGERFYVWIMLLSILSNYAFAIAIEKYLTRRKILLALGVCVNILLLTYFKYANFIIENIQLLSKNLGAPLSIQKIENLRLPIGISFFTFQGLSYLVDIYRRQTVPQKNIVNLGLYISLFPQLIAGPIVRYIDIEKQIVNRIKSWHVKVEGVERFVIGLAKKVLLANSFATVADGIFNLPIDQVSTPLAWIGALAYTFQIYFDFSGYSDMAIGLGRMLGFNFMENFNYPYISKSIQEFWRRWHISLSTWFRDYLYIPLGGSRTGKWKIYRNLLIVFFITGLWHGASWNFIIWGLFHGLFIVLERLGLAPILSKAPQFLARLYTLLVVVIGWVLFRAADLNYAGLFLQEMFAFNGFTNASYSHMIYLYSNEVIVVTLIGVLFCTPILPYLKNLRLMRVKLFQLSYTASLLGLFYLITLYLSASTYNPFIYFRF